MSTLLPFIPWILLGVMVVFAGIFSIVAWRAVRGASGARAEVEQLRGALRSMEQRAQAAEGQIEAANERARAAEARVAQAENVAATAENAAQQAWSAASEAERAAENAMAEARRADAQYRERRDENEERARQASRRAESLLSWARQQWEARRESDRQQAQSVQGSFQAQLDAYLQYRRVPVSFRAESEVDRLAAPLLARNASSEHIRIEGADVMIEFPVDASLGFRA